MIGMASILCFDIDNTFGPYAGDCRGGFDFTLLFEESILTLFPVTLLLLVAPARIYYLLAKQTKVHRSWIVILKLVRLSVSISRSFQAFVLILSYSVSICHLWSLAACAAGPMGWHTASSHQRFCSDGSHSFRRQLGAPTTLIR